MAELLTQGIAMVWKIKGVVNKFNRNNKECDSICDTVEKLNDSLSTLREVSVKEHQSVREAMQRLNDTLKETATEVEKCQNTNAMIRLFQTKDIASNLERLRNDIYEKMLSALFLTTLSANYSLRQEMSTNSAEMQNVRQDVNSLRQEMSTNSAVMQNVRQDVNSMKKDIAAIFKHFGVSGDACNENRTGTEKTYGASTGLRQYSRWSDLKAATNNNIIFKRYGSSSSIHKAELENGPVAIKKFHKMDEQARARFVHELKLVQKLHQHRNVVKLLGFCFEYNESLVVEDNDVKVASKGALGFISRYMSKESVAEVIIKGNEDVGWPSLFRIIQGIAEGIRHLHRENVVHLDLRPENILFDDTTPKINNFGKAQQLEEGESWIKLDEEQLPGKGKYVAPELSASTGSEYGASTKSDVYSFGVILVEIIGLMCATSKKGLRPRDPEQWAKRMQESELVDLFNPQRITSGTQRAAARWCVIVGLLCCLPDPEERPSMSKVIAMLGSYVQEEETNSIAATTTRSPQGKVKINMASSSTSSSLLLYDSKSTSVRNNELVRYKVLTEVMLHKQQDDDISRVASALQFVPGVAELLLRHNGWLPEKVLSEWCDKGVTLREVAGLPTQDDHKTITMMKVSTQGLKCLKCKGSFNAGQMWSAVCGHYYCQRCWGDHIGMAASVWIECMMSPSCKKPVVRELVKEVAGDEVRMQYDGFVRLSYVDDSCGRRKWCPRCNSNAVELLDDDGTNGSTAAAANVVCQCKHLFCWNCREKPHHPRPCYT